MVIPELVSKKRPTFHDFPYDSPDRKCFHCWIINVTPPGKNQCLHQCRYCYARDAIYARNMERLQVYSNLPELVESELSRITLCPPFSISNVSDPCQDIPELRKEVKRLIALLMKYGVSFLITTKGDPSFLLDLPGFISYERKAVAITIEGTSGMLPLLSPGAPSFDARIKTLRELSVCGISTIVRLDPLFKHLFEAIYGQSCFKQITGLLQDFARNGAKHVICSTGRLTKRMAGTGTTDTQGGSWNRVKRIIEQNSRQAAARFAQDYAWESGWMGKGYMLRYRLRIDLHTSLRQVAEALGMTYAVCQELPATIGDTRGIAHCAGVMLPFSRKSDDGLFYPVENCTANCYVSCSGISFPPCGRPALTGTGPHKISMLK